MSKVLILLLFIITGCSVHRIVYSDSNELHGTDLILQKLKSLSAVSNKKVSFSCLVNYNSNNYKFRGNFFFESDSVIILQLVSDVLGVEAVKAKLYNDSLLLINRLNQSYFLGRINQYLGFENFTLNTVVINKLLSGRLVLIDSVTPVTDIIQEPDEFESNNSSFYEISQPFLSVSGLINMITLTDKHGYLKSVCLVSETNNDFTICLTYSNFNGLDRIPGKVDINFNLVKLKGVINLQYQSIKKLKSNSIFVKVPKNYQRVNL